MYITMKFIRKRIGEQVEYINNILNNPGKIADAADRAEKIESAQVIQKRFEHYKDLCKGRLGIEIENVTFDVVVDMQAAEHQIMKEVAEILAICFGTDKFPESQTFNPKPPSHIK